MTESVCWQHLVKVSHNKPAAGSFFSTLIRTVRPHVRVVDFSDAQQFIERYEWLGNVGAASLSYALFYEEHLAAVVCFSPPTSPTGFSKLLKGVKQRQMMQLCRGASVHWAPNNAASRLIGGALRDLHRNRCIRWVFAYADPRAGEIGTVYQAANAIYLGPTDARGPGHYVINGEVMHPRAVYRAFGSARHETLVKLDPHYERHQRNKKHRYVFILGSGQAKKQMIERLGDLIRPYPKREQRRPAEGPSRPHPHVGARPGASDRKAETLIDTLR